MIIMLQFYIKTLQFWLNTNLHKISDSYGSRQTQDEILSRDYRQYNTSNMSISQASARAQADFTQGTRDINNYVSPFLISKLKIKSML